MSAGQEHECRELSVILGLRVRLVAAPVQERGNTLWYRSGKIPFPRPYFMSSRPYANAQLMPARGRHTYGLVDEQVARAEETDCLSQRVQNWFAWSKIVKASTCALGDFFQQVIVVTGDVEGSIS